MTFDYAASEQQILALLAPAASSSGIPLHKDEDVVDLTDGMEIPVGAQVVFLDLVPAEQVGRAARYLALWAFDLYLDPSRATPVQKAAAAARDRDLCGPRRPKACCLANRRWPPRQSKANRSSFTWPRAAFTHPMRLTA